MLKSLTNKSEPVAAVWLVDSRSVSDHDLTRHYDWLNADEVVRYQKFIRPERQRQFLIGRILLRLALAKLLQIESDKIELSERVGHAPVLISPASALAPGFSLSHSGPWIACAVSSNAVLGLDIEVLDHFRNFLALSEHAFDVAEQKSLAALPDIERAAAFYELWSHKEASFKFRSNCSSEPASDPHCLTLPHPSLSLVLASANPWEVSPEIIQVALELGLPPVPNTSS
ncbi:MAG: 4'-phosphopantetheinyl transferase superfamily protein [Pseudomonadota bacterium]